MGPGGSATRCRGITDVVPSTGAGPGPAQHGFAGRCRRGRGGGLQIGPRREQHQRRRRALSGIAQGQPVSFLVPILISAVTGYSITLLLSVIYRFLIDQRPFIMWSLTFVSVSLATIGYAYTDVWVLQTIRDGVDATPFAQLWLAAIYINSVLLAAWSALYYAINYFVRAEEQADQIKTAIKETIEIINY